MYNVVVCSMFTNASNHRRSSPRKNTPHFSRHLPVLPAPEPSDHRSALCLCSCPCSGRFGGQRAAWTHSLWPSVGHDPHSILSAPRLCKAAFCRCPHLCPRSALPATGSHQSGTRDPTGNHADCQHAGTQGNRPPGSDSPRCPRAWEQRGAGAGEDQLARVTTSVSPVTAAP